LKTPDTSIKLPLISIITVVYNGEKHLEKTIQSVIHQTYKNIEYIIVDGGSTDKTIDIIKKYSSQINYWISEKDKGIYDAMNKGLIAATGDFVWFINAGDLIYENNILEKIFNSSNTISLPFGEGQGGAADVYYGETEEINEDGSVIGMRRLQTSKNLSWKSFAMGMVVCHQSIIIKREVTENYNLEYRYSADIDWIIRALKKSKTILNTNLILSKFQKGGTSRHHIMESLKERFSIMTRHYGFLTTFFNHFIIGTKFFIFIFKNKRF